MSNASMIRMIHTLTYVHTHQTRRGTHFSNKLLVQLVKIVNHVLEFFLHCLMVAPFCHVVCVGRAVAGCRVRCVCVCGASACTAVVTPQGRERGSVRANAELWVLCYVMNTKKIHWGGGGGESILKVNQSLRCGNREPHRTPGTLRTSRPLAIQSEQRQRNRQHHTRDNLGL